MTAVRTLRQRAGISMQELADSVGVSRQAVSAWEIEDAWPSAEILPAIARALGCRIDDLYTEPRDEGGASSAPTDDYKQEVSQ